MQKKWLAAAALILLGVPARADNIVCHASPDFFVIAQDRDDEVGTAFLVRRKTSPDQQLPCRFEPQPADFRIGEPGDAYHFEALRGGYLALTASTGPRATLHVFDLDRRKRVVEVRLAEAGEPKLDGDRLDVSLSLGPATAKTCKDLAKFKRSGGSGEISVPATVDLSTGTLKRGDRRTCTYVQ